MSTNAVFGVYPTWGDAKYAVGRLNDEGFLKKDISVLFPRDESSIRFPNDEHNTAREWAATGAEFGAIVGAALGWLAGIGALAVPNAEVFVAAGPFIAACAGLGVGGAAGGIFGILFSEDVPEYEAIYYAAGCGLADRNGKSAILLGFIAIQRGWMKRRTF